MNKVYLVGAGPGDAGLLTVKALELIRRADVIIYDRLADESILKLASPTAEMIYVGKSAGNHTLSQWEINQLLIEKALKGGLIVRLKGGDPFVFGRGGEEALALSENQIEFEIVPGVTSAIAVAAYAGIPVTHRGIATSFAVVTGHEMNDERSNIRWDKLATAVDTLVFLMGVANIGKITERLIENGRSPDTPAAIIRCGTRPNQEVFITTVGMAAADVEREGITPPAIFIVGDVVNLRDQLKWFETRPLFGQTVVVTRARAQASELTRKLTALGARCIEVPTIEIAAPTDDYEGLDCALDCISTYDIITFTSVNGVDKFFERLFLKGLDVRAINGKIAAIGSATAGALRRFEIVADYVPKEFRAEALIELLRGLVEGKKILLARAEEARDILPKSLRDFGASVDVVAAYRTISAVADGDAKTFENADWITFTSSSTVKNFIKGFGLDALAFLKTAAIGPITADTLRSYGLEPTVSAAQYTLDGLTDAIIDNERHKIEDFNIRFVVDGFNAFIRQLRQTKRFDFEDLKSFMEPIFTIAGYREGEGEAPQDIKNILIFHNMRVGDFVIMSAAIREIRRLYPDAHITLLVGALVGGLADCCPYVDEVIIENFISDNTFVFDCEQPLSPEEIRYIAKMFSFDANIAERFLERQYDIAFIAPFATHSSMPLLAYMSGAKRRVAPIKGFWSPLLTDIAPRRLHTVDRMLGAVELISGETITNRRLEAWFSEEDLNTIKELMPQSKRIYAIGLGGSFLRKHWSPESYAALIDMIVAEDDEVAFVLFGGARDVEEANVLIANTSSSRVVNLVDKISFRQAAAAFSLCDMYIGNDTATAHLAAANQKPCLIVECFPLDLGRTSISLKQFHPYDVPNVVVCPSHALPECRDSKDLYGCAADEPHCITLITPQHMFEAFKILLNQIRKGSNDCLLYDTEKKTVEPQADRNVQLVVDGFNKFLENLRDSSYFNIDEMKDFMEAVFTEAGYRQADPDGVQNILILHDLQVGDFVVLSPAIRAARLFYPNAHITLIVNKTAAELAEKCPYVDEIIVHSYTIDRYFKFNLRGYLESDDLAYVLKIFRYHFDIAKKVLNRRYDLAFCFIFEGSTSPPLCAYLSGAKRRFSFCNSRYENLLTDLIQRKTDLYYNRFDSDFHLLNSALNCVEYAAGKRAPNRRLEVWISQEDIDTVKKLMPQSKRVYAVNFGGFSYLRKHYPPEYYAVLADLIAQYDSDVSFILIGGPTEADEAQIFIDNVHTARVVDLTGKIPFRQTAAAISLCDVLITNTSATTHIAAAVRTPTMEIHRVTSALKSHVLPHSILGLSSWHPYDVPSVAVLPGQALIGCKIKECQAETPHCITQITPQSCFDALKILLEQIEKGNNDYVLYDSERGVVDFQREVPLNDVNRAVEELACFIENLIETRYFNVEELKDFMEPIFAAAGYRQAKPDDAIDSILIVNDATSEDFVATLPILRELRQRYPAAKITMLINRRSQSIAACCPYVNDFVIKESIRKCIPWAWEKPTAMKNVLKRLACHWSVVRYLLERRYDIALATTDLLANREGAFFSSFDDWLSAPLIAYMSGARRRVAVNAGMWAPLLTATINDEFDFVEYLGGAPLNDWHVDFYFSSETLRSAKYFMPQSKKVYAIGLFEIATPSQDLLNTFKTLMERIMETDEDVSFVLIGDPSEVENADFIADGVDLNRFINLVDNIKVRGSLTAAVLSHCDVFIGNGIETLHLALSVHTPALVVIEDRVEAIQSISQLPKRYKYDVPSVTVCDKFEPQDIFGAFKMLLEQIDKGENNSVIYDLEKRALINLSTIDENVLRVVDGFSRFIAHIEDIKNFDAEEMKNFMEPIFEKAGYREVKDDGAIDNVLILHDAAAGDFVMMSPLIRETRRLYPKAHITLVANYRIGNLADNCPYIDELIIKKFVHSDGERLQNIPRNLHDIVEKCRFHLNVSLELLPRRYDIAFAPKFANSHSTQLLAYVSGAKRRVSQDIEIWSPLLTDVIDPTNYGVHAANVGLALIEHLTGTIVADRRIEAWFSQDNIDTAKALMPKSEKIYAIGLGSSSRKKHYPPESYATFINLIMRDDDEACFVLLGGATEIDEAAIIMNDVDESRVINLVNKFSYSQTAAATSLCKVYIGCDSGVSHIAAANKVPILNVGCFPTDLIKLRYVSGNDPKTGMSTADIQMWLPYQVPAVMIMPKQALPGCKSSQDWQGCRAGKPHCVTQIKPQHLFDAFTLLQKRIEKGATDYVLYDIAGGGGHNSSR